MRDHERKFAALAWAELYAHALADAGIAYSPKVTAAEFGDDHDEALIEFGVCVYIPSMPDAPINRRRVRMFVSPDGNRRLCGFCLNDIRAEATYVAADAFLAWCLRSGIIRDPVPVFDPAEHAPGLAD